MASTPQNGEALWHARRKAWREARPQQPPVTSSQSLSAWLNENIQDRKQHLGIYNSLVVSRKPLNKPIPLSFIVKVLVEGWKEDGTWPEGMEAPRTTDATGF
ncbi:hypothetical protein VTP01DRAFT_1251 [Rhizomucor pusillus]|uniref:uncharacterized protein n=1 Tax=Rhizomucor pusillus TaxID=4840 RepID=UPI003742ABFB